MSYILDALRKADAERERDPARGIHAQPALAPAAGSRRRSTAWAASVAAAVVAGGLGYLAWGRGEPPQVAAVGPATTPARPLATPAADASPQAATAPVFASTGPAASSRQPAAAVADRVSPPPPAPVERMATQAVVAPRIAALAHPAPAPAVPPPARPAPVRAVTVAAASEPAVLKAPPGAVAALAPAAATPTGAPPAAPGAAILKAPPGVAAPAAAAAPAAGDRILAVAELPPDVQRDLPKLAISGGVHSDNPAQRMLIVGGQVMTEGQELAPGVLLEQIRPRSAVLRFRGLRYSITY